jgi:hypothetical protein
LFFQESLWTSINKILNLSYDIGSVNKDDACPTPPVQLTPAEIELADQKLHDYYNFTVSSGRLDGIDYVQDWIMVKGHKVWGRIKVTRHDWDSSWDGKSE